jgi:hypothetical protein
MATLFVSRARTVWQARTALRVAWAAALLVLTATYVRADDGYPIVVDQHALPLTAPACVRPYSALYTKIQDAINVAPSGSKILVCPGTYAEQITIRTSLTLSGVTNTAGNTGAVVITAPQTGLLISYASSHCGFPCQVDAQVFVQAPNVTLIDIIVDGTGALSGCSSPDLAGVDFDNGSSGTLWRVALRNQNIPDGNGGYCPGSGGGFDQGGAAGAAIVSEHASSVAVYGSSVRGFSRYGLVANYANQVTNSVVVRDTTFVGVGGQNCSADVLAFANSLEVSGSTLANCNRGVLVFPSAGQVTVTGNTIVNPVQDGVNIVGCSTLNISNNTIVGNGTGSRGIWLACPGNSNYNEISGVHIAIEPAGGNTVIGNEINDADIGIDHAPGNNVSGNTFLNVTTLTTP